MSIQTLQNRFGFPHRFLRIHQTNPLDLGARILILDLFQVQIRDRNQVVFGLRTDLTSESQISQGLLASFYLPKIGVTPVELFGHDIRNINFQILDAVFLEEIVEIICPKSLISTIFATMAV